MNRLRMSQFADQPLNLSNEIIDLTGDSPVVNSARVRGPHGYNISELRYVDNNIARNSRARHITPIPLRYDPLTSVERDDSYIQVIDPDEGELMGHQIGNVEKMRGMHGAKSNEECSATVPCINDSCSGQQIVLSCPICFEALSAERRPMATSCGHIFCGGCLKTALERSGSKSCPKCNSTVKIKSCIRLYF